MRSSRAVLQHDARLLHVPAPPIVTVPAKVHRVRAVPQRLADRAWGGGNHGEEQLDAGHAVQGSGDSPEGWHRADTLRASAVSVDVAKGNTRSS